jgi:hypothetical protein
MHRRNTVWMTAITWRNPLDSLAAAWLIVVSV